MHNRRKCQRIVLRRDIQLSLFDKSRGIHTTQPIQATLADLTRHGAMVTFSRVLAEGRHLFYAALESDDLLIAIKFAANKETAEPLPTLLTRPVWFDRDMHDDVQPFRMGLQFVSQIPPFLLPCSTQTEEQPTQP